MSEQVRHQMDGIVKLDPQALMQSAIDQGADIEKLERLIALAKDVRAEQARAAWYEAMAEFQKEAPKILKSKKANLGSFSYSYAPLDEILGNVQPVMGPLGLSISFRLTEANAQQVTYIARIVHALGHHEDSGPVSMPIVQGGNVTEGKGANPAQRVGIAHSYAKRYAALAILGIAPEDDGDGASHGGQAPSSVRQPQRASASNGDDVQVPKEGPAGDPNLWTGRVKQVREKSGEKDGRPWTLYTIVGHDGMEFATFDKKIGDFANEAGLLPVQIRFEKSSRGNLSATSIEPANA
jgi:hypothetical protein